MTGDCIKIREFGLMCLEGDTISGKCLICRDEYYPDSAGECISNQNIYDINLVLFNNLQFY